MFKRLGSGLFPFWFNAGHVGKNKMTTPTSKRERKHVMCVSFGLSLILTLHFQNLSEDLSLDFLSNNLFVGNTDKHINMHIMNFWEALWDQRWS